MSCPPPCPKPVKPSCGGHRKSHDEPACRVKPVMKGLHWAQTQRIIGQALALSLLGGISTYMLVGRRRRKQYKEFYETVELEEWADEMARKGLFQAVPSTSMKDFQFCRSQS